MIQSPGGLVPAASFVPLRSSLRGTLLPSRFPCWYHAEDVAAFAVGGSHLWATDVTIQGLGSLEELIL